MPSEPTLDMEALTAPISADQPAGSYLKETDYDRLQNLKDIRVQSVASERKAREIAMYSDEELKEIHEQDRYIEPPKWRDVRDDSITVLSEHSKDMWVAAWLIEANTRLAGFAGLRDGFQLVAELADKFWSDISPPSDEEEGYLGTVSQLTSLNGAESDGVLILPIYEAPLIPGRPELNYSNYRQATKGTAGDVTEGEFLAAAREIGVELLRTHSEDIQGAIDSFEVMNQTLEKYCGEVDGVPVAPPSTQILKAMQECQTTFALITRDLLGSESEEDENDVDSELSASGGTTKTDRMQSQVTSREDAFRLLLRASEFFRKTEPHSPVSYMLQQAVRFGRMDLPGLLQELITDEDVLTRFAERTGIKIERDEEPENE
jgi:type VI secretion system protein ImpA